MHKNNEYVIFEITQKMLNLMNNMLLLVQLLRKKVFTRSQLLPHFVNGKYYHNGKPVDVLTDSSTISQSFITRSTPHSSVAGTEGIPVGQKRLAGLNPKNYISLDNSDRGALNEKKNGFSQLAKEFFDKICLFEKIKTRIQATTKPEKQIVSLSTDPDTVKKTARNHRY